MRLHKVMFGLRTIVINVDNIILDLQRVPASYIKRLNIQSHFDFTHVLPSSLRISMVANSAVIQADVVLKTSVVETLFKHYRCHFFSISIIAMHTRCTIASRKDIHIELIDIALFNNY